jgi:hypothetical protein
MLKLVIAIWGVIIMLFFAILFWWILKGEDKTRITETEAVKDG